MRPTPTPHRDHDPCGSLKLRASPAQIEHVDHVDHARSRAHAHAHEAAAARRYLRRRREVFLCALVAVLGVLTARSIPLIEHERELCACRSAIATFPLSPGAGSARIVVSGATPLREHDAPPAQSWSPERGSSGAPRAVDLIITDVGALVTASPGYVVLAERCDDPVNPVSIRNGARE